MELYDLLKYLITGPMGSIYYGEPRFTNDIDESDVPGLVNSFPEDEVLQGRKIRETYTGYNRHAQSVR